MPHWEIRAGNFKHQHQIAKQTCDWYVYVLEVSPSSLVGVLVCKCTYTLLWHNTNTVLMYTINCHYIFYILEIYEVSNFDATHVLRGGCG